MLPPTLSRTSPRFNPNGRSVARQARRTRESVCPAPRRPIPKPTLSCCVESPSDLAPLRTVNVDQRTEARKKQLEKSTQPGTRIPGGDNGTIHCCFLPLEEIPPEYPTFRGPPSVAPFRFLRAARVSRFFKPENVCPYRQGSKPDSWTRKPHHPSSFSFFSGRRQSPREREEEVDYRAVPLSAHTRCCFHQLLPTRGDSFSSLRR